MFRNKAKLLEDGYKPEGDLLTKMDGPICVDVYHIGKYPQIFGSCHYKNGHSWNIRYRAITLQIPNLISFLKYRFGDLFTEIKYAFKSFRTVKSGFVEWQSKFSEDGVFCWDAANFDYDEPYYICGLFENGRHIPLPILANWEPDENRLQKWAISKAGGDNLHIPQGWMSPEDALVEPNIKFVVIIDVAKHDGHIEVVDENNVWTPENAGGWTYQSLSGAHGSVYAEYDTEEEAREILDKWLECDSVETDTYCYTHNPY